ncbi:MAG: biopolymer transporter ExbD [Neomegalonema sp.]|nr:biopolymer transporter ExbD [Neomegalonema sp.]
MRLDVEPPKERGEAIAPMINIVFLLLIFFLMSATITQRLPLEATPPASDATEAVELHSGVLVIAATGEIAYETARDDAAIRAAAGAALAAKKPVRLRADARAPAAQLVRAIAALRRAGAEDVRLTTQERPQ